MNLEEQLAQSRVAQEHLQIDTRSEKHRGTFGFKVIYKGLEVSMDSIDELDALIDHMQVNEDV